MNLEIPEFTCLCPRTGQPDLATIRITDVPARCVVELKSLTLCVWSYRNGNAFHGEGIDRILDGLVAAVAPRWIQVIGDCGVRGGIETTIGASHGRRAGL